MAALRADVEADLAMPPDDERLSPSGPPSGQIQVHSPPPVAVDGSYDRVLGELALLAGDIDGGERHLRRAVAQNEALGAPPLVARSQLGLARALLARGSLDDAAEATALLVCAHETAVALGMDLLVEWIDAARVPELPVQTD